MRTETLDSNIVNHIFVYTRGHRGLTCLLGKILDEDFRQQTGGLLPTYSQWQTLIRQIIEHVGDYKTMTKMIFSLRGKNNEAIQARKVLTQLITYG